MMSSGTESLFEAARLLRPQGRRGELLADPLSDLPGLFEQGCEFLLPAHPTQPSLVLEHCWRPTGRNVGRLVLKFATVDSIDDAEGLQGKSLFVPESSLPAREEGTYLVRDLLDCLVVNGDEPVGKVVDLQYTLAADGHTRVESAADLLAVQLVGAADDAEPVLIPFIKAWLVGVDLAEKRITMRLPEGLLSAAEPDEPAHL